MKNTGLIREHSNTLSLIMRAGDVLTVLLVGIGVYSWWPGVWPMPSQYQIAFFIAFLLIPLIFPMSGTYRSWRGGRVVGELRNLTLAWTVVVTILIIAAFATKTSSDFSRLWMGLWIVGAWSVLMCFRISLRLALRWARGWGLNTRRIVIVGAGQLGRQVVQRINEAPWAGLRVMGLYDDNTEYHGQVIEGVKVRGSPARLVRSVKPYAIDEVWLALPLRAEERMKEILYELRHSTVAVRFVPDIFGFRLLNHSFSEVAGMPVMSLNASPMVGANRVLKTLLDWVLSLAILMVISPLMLAIAVGVKATSRGPILFKQRRHGWDGRSIEIYKFRTMVVHKECDGGVTQACRDDVRVTPLGSFLRRTSLDELPQFLNVLQGRMSIVGPRPHAIEHNEQYKEVIDAYMQRHKVKPGITGWAQVNGWRGETDTLEKMEKRVEYDLYYIENWSLWFDIKIIFMTFFKGFIHKNAY